MCTAPVKTIWRNSGDIAEPNLEVNIFEKKASGFLFSRQFWSNFTERGTAKKGSPVGLIISPPSRQENLRRLRLLLIIMTMVIDGEKTILELLPLPFSTIHLAVHSGHAGNTSISNPLLQ